MSAENKPAKPIYVPIALSLEQAEHVYGAVKAVIDSCKAVGRPIEEWIPLSAALVTIGQQIEKKRAEAMRDA